MSSKSFSLTEILIAITLMGLIVLAVASVDITSRRFFGTSKDETWIQDEAKIAMQHITSRVQRGVGNISNDSTAVGNPPDVDDSRGFFVLDSAGNLVNEGSPGGFRIQVKVDTNSSGQFELGTDEFVEYEYRDETSLPVEDRNSIRFYPDKDTRSNYETLAEGIVESAIFEYNSNTPNQVKVTITVLREPGEDPSLDNPQTTLTSSIILKAMSTR